MRTRKEICSYIHATSLNNTWRHKLQNPRVFLKPFIKEGMSVLDYGCGNGFCTFDIEFLLKGKGRLIAADLQPEMLDAIKQRMKLLSDSEFIELHQCDLDSTRLKGPFNFILLFWMFHEVSNQAKILTELASLLDDDGRILLSEPYCHVSQIEFNQEIAIARQCGLCIVKGPRIFFSRTILITKHKVI